MFTSTFSVTQNWLSMSIDTKTWSRGLHHWKENNNRTNFQERMHITFVSKINRIALQTAVNVQYISKMPPHSQMHLQKPVNVLLYEM